MPDLGGADVVEQMRGDSEPFETPGSSADLARVSTRRPAPLTRTTKTSTLPGGIFVTYA